MVSLGQLDKLYFWVLGIVFLQVDEELLIVAGVDGCCYSVSPLCEHREHSVIDEIVNQYDFMLSTPNKVRDIGPCIPDATRRENLLGQKLGANVLDFVKNNLNGFVCLLLMLLNVKDPLNDLRVVIDELRYHGECPHDANVNLHGCVRP